VGVTTCELGAGRGRALDGDLTRAGTLGIQTRNPGGGRGRTLDRGDLGGSLGVGLGDPNGDTPDVSTGFGILDYGTGVRIGGGDIVGAVAGCIMDNDLDLPSMGLCAEDTLGAAGGGTRLSWACAGPVRTAVRVLVEAAAPALEVHTAAAMPLAWARSTAAGTCPRATAATTHWTRAAAAATCA
jgi:hypothetical protein